MAENSILEQVARGGIVPVIILDELDWALPVADAIMAGGLNVIEITFRTKAAAEGIRRIATERPQMIVGAGTVLTRENLEAAKSSGATFAVSPGLNPAIATEAARLGLPLIPGIATPTEIEAALSLGCTLLKYFPAEALGGVTMLEAIAAPYKHTRARFMPTGGVTPANLESYLRLSCVAAVGGTWFAKKDDMAGAKWPEIRQRTRAAVDLVRKLRGA